MARYMQLAVLVAALSALCAVDVLTAAIDSSGAPRGADAADAAKTISPSGDGVPAATGEAAAKADAVAAAEEDADHVRDKRRLPDPGFIIPATPMGFSKNGQPAQQAPPAQPQEARSERQPTPSTPSQAERKTSSMAASASSAHPTRGSYSYADSVTAQTRQKKAPVLHKSGKPVPGSREAPLGREEHVRALKSFLEQTRKLGVPDEQALKLLDKELAKAKRQGPAYRPVYHATPLKPYGALINFNQAPYEKHQLKGMKPIKEQQNDIPPPNKPIVVESDRQILGAKATPSPAPIPGQHTEALVTPNGPLRVSVPKQIEPQHLLQSSQKFNPVQLSGPLSGAQHSYQTISLPVASYKPEEAYQTLQSLDHSQYLQATPIEQTVDSETPVSLEAMHSYPAPEQHIISAPIQHEHVISTVAAPQVTVEEVHQPVYVYRQEEVKIPPPQAEVHVELPAKQVIHEPVHQGGLYHDQKEHPEEYASQYRFGYRVRDQHAGNDFGHAETRDGKMTKGEYFVTLPDGRLQSVKYWADQGGYHAQISYTSHAAHPAPAH